MKQHITIDQWNEIKLLSPDIPHDMNIGQMIEFLDDFAEFSIEQGELVETREVVDIYKITFTYPSKMAKKLELCDALWEAVKEVLNKNAQPFD